MSKSDPESSIFMDDSEDDVARKIRHAYFPSPVELYRRGRARLFVSGLFLFTVR
jgi:tryptophanyl-tRNA synthetase